MLNRDLSRDSISNIRKEIAKELYNGRKFVPTRSVSDSKKVEIKCLTAFRYKQHFGKKVVLYCQSSESAKTFIWSFQGVAVSSDQTCKFILSKDKVGDYFCCVRYDDGRLLHGGMCCNTIGRNHRREKKTEFIKK